MEFKSVVHTYNRILFSPNNKENPVRHDETWGNYAKWNKQVTDEEIMHDTLICCI